MEKFKIFIGFKNLVCCNMCISTDGLKSELRVRSPQDLLTATLRLFQEYNSKAHLQAMSLLQEKQMTEHQFAQLIGKSRMYQFLPSQERKALPSLEFTDSHISTISKAYYSDENFSRNEDSSIDLWRVYNLFTGANKSSYIDTFLDRSLNASQFVSGIGKALSGDAEYRWFIEQSLRRQILLLSLDGRGISFKMEYVHTIYRNLINDMIICMLHIYSINPFPKNKSEQILYLENPRS